MKSPSDTTSDAQNAADLLERQRRSDQTMAILRLGTTSGAPVDETTLNVSYCKSLEALGMHNLFRFWVRCQSRSGYRCTRILGLKSDNATERSLQIMESFLKMPLIKVIHGRIPKDGCSHELTPAGVALFHAIDPLFRLHLQPAFQQFQKAITTTPESAS